MASCDVVIASSVSSTSCKSFFFEVEASYLLFCRKPAELLEVSPVIRDKVPVIRRFTGGGTVIVDHGTVFVTFICNKDAFPDVQPYPKPIMKWSSLIYNKVFQGIGDFSLRENGKCIKLSSFIILLLQTNMNKATIGKFDLGKVTLSLEQMLFCSLFPPNQTRCYLGIWSF